MKLCESITAEFLSLSTYFFYTQWAKIRPDMAEIAKLCENELNITFIAWKGVN